MPANAASTTRIQNIYRGTRERTHPLGQLSTPIFSTTRGNKGGVIAHTMQMVALMRSRRELFIDASHRSGFAPSPLSTKSVRLRNFHRRGCAIMRVARRLVGAARKCTVYNGVYLSHPSGPIFHARYLHRSWDSVGAKRDRRWKHLAEGFPKAYR